MSENICVYSCDFETNNNPLDCRVWLWGSVNVNNLDEKIYGVDIESFFEWCGKKSKKLYFHNLKFDGEFILSKLLRDGFTHTNSFTPDEKEFTTAINEQGVFYSLTFKTKYSLVRIFDSLKLLPFSVESMAKNFGFSETKTSIDYKMQRDNGYTPTKPEIDYVLNDVVIVAKALKFLFNNKFTKMTIGSNAFFSFKQSLGGEKKFRNIFPELECDSFIRKAYKGGFTYVNPQFQNNWIGSGCVFDVNSLYSFAMHSPHAYPYGYPYYYKGKYIQNKEYPIYFQRVRCDFQLREGFLPTIQIKNSRFFSPISYLSNSNNEYPELTLTNLDLELFFESYEVFNLQYIDGFAFKSVVGMFDEYIDFWVNQKTISKKK